MRPTPCGKEKAFTAWTQSEHFRAAHRNAGDNKPLYLGHPEFEGFEVIQTVRKPDGAATDLEERQTTAAEDLIWNH